MNSEAVKALSTLANEADVLIFGEVHGTQEVPQLVSHYLEIFQNHNYGALGLEIPNAEQGPLRKWAVDEVQAPPPFFARPFGDGRGNEQMLALVRQVIGMGWHVLCFDPGIVGNWRQRDLAMAENLLAEWKRTCPNKKVICVCGNLHSRLTPASDFGKKFWPSFAANVQLLSPEAVVKSINVVFHQGAFFNGKVRKLNGKPITRAYVSNELLDGHSLSLHLPNATPVTHLTRPVPIRAFPYILVFLQAKVREWMSKLKPD